MTVHSSHFCHAPFCRGLFARWEKRVQVGNTFFHEKCWERFKKDMEGDIIIHKGDHSKEPAPWPYVKIIDV